MWEAPSMNAVFHLEGSFMSLKLVKSSHFVMKSHVGSTFYERSVSSREEL